MPMDEPVWAPTVFTKSRDRLLNKQIARSFSAQLSARTFCTFLREFSSFRRKGLLTAATLIRDTVPPIDSCDFSSRFSRLHGQAHGPLGSRPVRKLRRGRIARQSARSRESQEACSPGTRPNLVVPITNLGAPCTGPASRARLRHGLAASSVRVRCSPRRRLGQPTATGSY